MYCGSDNSGSSPSARHLPVLLEEVLDLLVPEEEKMFLDATFGGGGHTRALLESGEQVSVVAIDCDPEAAERAKEFTKLFPGRFTFYDLNFSEMDQIEEKNFDGILFDYGVSSFHFDNFDRGFSFRGNAPADMRLNPREGETAAEFLENASRQELIMAIKVYGEDRSWRRIVDAILDARGTGALNDTLSIADLISNAIPAPVRRKSKIHPATKTFQGVRIAVNRELDVIKTALPKAFELLAPGGILAAISFHSLEDRIVKRYFRTLCGQPVDRRDNTPQQLRSVYAEAVTRKPLTAKEGELEVNPRSRSAKLRAVRKTVGLGNAV